MDNEGEKRIFFGRDATRTVQPENARGQRRHSSGRLHQQGKTGKGKKK